MNKELTQLKKKIVPILKKHDVIQAGIFGSYARGEQNKKSDVDLLIKYKPRSNKSLLDLVGLQNILEDKINKKFDIITYDSIYFRLKDHILNDEQRIICLPKNKKTR